MMMALVVWNDRYSVGVAELDNHHKKLMSLINELHDAMKAGKGKDALGVMLKELLDYTNFHFRAEEAHMKKKGYSGLALHAVEHKQFVEKVNNSIKEYENGRLSLTMEVMEFLKSWLVNHIMVEDKKYV